MGASRHLCLGQLGEVKDSGASAEEWKGRSETENDLGERARTQYIEWEKGCTGETFEGHALMALALAGRWDRVDAALARVPLSMGGRVAEVRAAHHLRTGDPRYAEVLAAFPDDPGLAARADALARSGGTP